MPFQGLWFASPLHPFKFEIPEMDSLVSSQANWPPPSEVTCPYTAYSVSQMLLFMSFKPQLQHLQRSASLNAWFVRGVGQYPIPESCRSETVLKPQHNGPICKAYIDGASPFPLAVSGFTCGFRCCPKTVAACQPGEHPNVPPPPPCPSLEPYERGMSTLMVLLIAPPPPSTFSKMHKARPAVT